MTPLSLLIEFILCYQKVTVQLCHYFFRSSSFISFLTEKSQDALRVQ